MRILSHVPPTLLERVRQQLPDAEIVPVPLRGEPPAEAAGEVLLTFTTGPPNLGALMRRGVRWVHAYGTGVDAFPFEVLDDRPLTCSRGASAVPIAEWVLAMLLSVEKRLPASWVSEPPETWNMADLGGLQGRTLGIVGLGSIGCEVAARALPFGMRVVAARRQPLPSPVAGVEIVSDLAALVETTDHLVLAAPATPATRGLVGRPILARAKRGLHLVNVARGSLLDQEALREALDDGRVALASLDVCDPEPLPAGHWLYRHPKVRLSPHVSWSMPGALDRLLDPFLENLHRYRSGQPLLHQVDVEQGY